METGLLEALKRPEVWPDSASDLQIHETHISWVFVTDHFAWKVKKPVSFGFLDFSTLERREHFCREELRLNRRLAPDLYLDVVPICQQSDVLRAGGVGAPVEFAVKMRRFNQRDLFSEAVGRGELVSADIDDLAAQLARFHETVAVAPANQACGSWTRIRAAADENFESLLTNVESPPVRELVQQLSKWTTNQMDQRATDFLQRQSAGFVRECHGDLHLGNITRYHGRPCVFDGIEFNDDFRWIDVMSEIAFLIMDLDEHGCADLGWRFLNAYLEHTGDYAGVKVLPFYLVYRSLVRAKVDAIRLGEPALPERTRRLLSDEFSKYLDVAEHDAHSPRPLLILMHGLSGSGKTTVSEKLLERFGAVRIRSDVERKRLFGLKSLDRPSPEQASVIYGQQADRQTYDRLKTLSGSVLESGFTAIIDATFLHRDERIAFSRIAEAHGVPSAIVSCQASADELRTRLRNRHRTHRDASDADIHVLERQLEVSQPLDSRERSTVIAFDTTDVDSLCRCVNELKAIQRASSVEPLSVN